VIDFNTQTWHQVKTWAETQLAQARVKNDSLQLSAEETSALRGEIRTLKRLLGLPKEASRAVSGYSED